VDLLFAGLGLGFVLAAQVGPVTLLIVRSVLRGGRAVAVGLAMAAAVALVDVLYAAVGLASAAILVGIGTHTLWRGLPARIGAEADDEVRPPGRAFATAGAATALNPLTIALWTSRGGGSGRGSSRRSTS
jgi:threonine/homoserine/homoserine lactone efflux protein